MSSKTFRPTPYNLFISEICSLENLRCATARIVAENCVKNLIAVDKTVKNAKVAILGFTFKENCPDTRNTKIIDIVNELKEYNIDPVIADPEADAKEAERLYGVRFRDIEKIRDMDAVILAVYSFTITVSNNYILQFQTHCDPAVL